MSKTKVKKMPKGHQTAYVMITKRGKKNQYKVKRIEIKPEIIASSGLSHDNLITSQVMKQ